MQVDSGSVNVKVLNPELKVTATTGGRDKQIIGRTIDYNFEVTNTGDGNADGSTWLPLFRPTLPSGLPVTTAANPEVPSVGISVPFARAVPAM